MEKRIAILTGDIVGSRTESPTTWLPALQEVLSQQTTKFDIFRGDSLQAELHIEKAIIVAISIKATMIALKLDARIGIGIGTKTHDAAHVKNSFGDALIYSGEAFDELKKDTLFLKSANEQTNRLCNVILSLVTALTERWTPNMAITVKAALEHTNLNQIDLAKLLKKKHQSQVSNELNKASFAKIQEALAYCTQAILVS